MSVVIRPRSSWTSTPFAWPAYPSRLHDKARVVYLAPHYPAVPGVIGVLTQAQEEGWMRTIRSWHVSPPRSWADIGYALVIHQSGRIYMAGGITHTTAHAGTANPVSIGVLFLVGDDEAPTPAALAAFNALGPWLRDSQGFTALEVVRDHGRLPGQATACAGARIRAAVDDGSLTLDGGAPMPTGLLPFPAASRLGTDGFWRDLEAVFRQAGYDVYCGPSYVARGACAPGRHPHGRTSRHFVARALDLGHDPASGAAVSPWEGAVLDATVRMLRVRYPRMGMVWNRGPGDHQDHAHVDDQDYGTEGRYTGHVIPGLVLFGDTGADVTTLQTNLRRAGHRLVADGVFGLATYDALRSFQHVHGLVPDGMAGDATRAHLPTYRLQAAINTYGWHLDVDGIDGPATRSAARQAATLAGYTGDLTHQARFAVHLEETMTQILSELRALREEGAETRRHLDRLITEAPKPPTVKEIVTGIFSRRSHGLGFDWWSRRGLVLDPAHRAFPADPGSPAHKELLAEAAESGRATVYTADGLVLLELDEDGHFQIKED